jgi:hypothetical protein
MTSRWAAFSLGAAVGIALVALRTWGISQHFWMLGEQIRDWTIALGSWRDLPLSGAPSTMGGRGLGPIYYWVLWAVRHAVGPWCSDLPHAGGIGISLMQSIADTALLFAIWRRLGSLPLAVAVVVLAATNPIDLEISATIWNPPVAVAFVKTAIAVVLIAGESIWWSVGATTIAWLAVQAHSSAAFVALPIMAAFVAREMMARRWLRAARTARAIVEVVLVLEVPYFIDRFRHPGEAIGPTGFVGRQASLNVFANTQSILGAFRFAAWPLQSMPSGWLLVIAAAAAVCAAIATRKDLPLASVTFVPLLMAIAAFARWRGVIESYWFLTLAPSMALTVGCAMTAIPRPAMARGAAAVFLAVALLGVPARYRQTTMTMPVYGALARGSVDIRRRAPAVADIVTDFELPRTSQRGFIYTTVLGGRLDPSAPYVAHIAGNGGVTFTSANR